jgi:uncharacterized caspase-like protein
MRATLRSLFAVLVLLCAAPLPAADAPKAGATPAEPRSKVALIIGNTNYANALPLKNPGNDASDLCASFKQLGFEVICKLDVASKREFKDAIYEFTGKVAEKSVAVFYFAGHGLQIDGVNYLVPTKAALRTKSDIEDESVQINYLMSELETRHAALNIFILDACRNNPYANPIRGYVPMLGLATQLYAPPNSIIAMSTGPGQLSLDGNDRNGTFTKNLLKYLPTPQQSIEDMFKAVSGGTRADARHLGRQQDPQITISFADKFCLAGCADPGRDEAQRKARGAELSRLEATLAQTKAKQAELDEQQADLQKKRAELDALRRSLDSVQSKQEELTRRQAEVAKRERELDALSSQIGASAAKLSELEAVRLALQKKQDEVNKMRDIIDAKNQEIRTRAIQAPEKKAQPITVVPTF